LRGLLVRTTINVRLDVIHILNSQPKLAGGFLMRNAGCRLLAQLNGLLVSFIGGMGPSELL